MSATDREVKSATGVDLLVPLAAQSAEKKDLNNFNLVVVTTLAQYKPAKLIAAATVQVTESSRCCFAVLFLQFGITKTIKEIAALYDALSLEFTDVSFPVIPKKISSKRTDAVEIDKFFHFLASSERLCKHKSVLAFFGRSGTAASGSAAPAATAATKASDGDSDLFATEVNSAEQADR